MTRERKDRSALVRLVLDDAGRPCVDLLGRAPGRGVHVRPSALALALVSPASSRAFRARATPLSRADAERVVVETLDRSRGRILDLVGLARRTGRLTIGFEAVRARLSAGGVEGVVVLATGVSERTRREIERSIGELPAIMAGTCESLGARLSRERVGVVLVEHTRLARAIRAEAERARGLSAQDELPGPRSRALREPSARGARPGPKGPRPPTGSGEEKASRVRLMAGE
ncbi:MAG: DUF448 domain-containing protein [Deltaproteobacteria bacterium]|nr:DUF448 domain-containing protein [Deltaproteobacteria bacterium]